MNDNKAYSASSASSTAKIDNKTVKSKEANQELKTKLVPSLVSPAITSPTITKPFDFEIKNVQGMDAWWTAAWWKDVLNFHSKEEEEVLLNPPQHNIYPERPEFQTLRNFYSNAVTTFWVHTEIDMTADAKDYNNQTHGPDKLSQHEKNTIKFFLSFFAFADLLVGEYLSKFTHKFKLQEVCKFYAQQAAIEAVHDLTYGKFINDMIPEKEQNEIRNAFKDHEVVKTKSMWIQKGFDDNIDMAIRIILFCIVEGVFFCSSFAFFFYLRECHRTKFPGLLHANEFIMRDETMHMDFGCELFRLWKHKPSQEMVHNIFRSAIAVEDLFIDAALPVKLPMLSSEQMKQYVRFMADRLLLKLGYDKLFQVKNPLPWMQQTQLETRLNFFERRTGTYQSATYNHHHASASSSLTFSSSEPIAGAAAAGATNADVVELEDDD